MLSNFKTNAKYWVFGFVATILLILSIISCGHVNNVLRLDGDNKTSSVTLDDIKEKCVPVEQYAFPALNVMTISFRTKDCLGNDDIFVVLWQTGKANTELARTVAQALTILFVDTKNNEMDPSMPKISKEFLGYSIGSDGEHSAAIYRLNRLADEDED